MKSEGEVEKITTRLSPSPPGSRRPHLGRRSTTHSAGREPRDRLLQLLRRLVLGGAEVLRLEADELLVLLYVLPQHLVLLQHAQVLELLRRQRAARRPPQDSHQDLAHRQQRRGQCDWLEASAARHHKHDAR